MKSQPRPKNLRTIFVDGGCMAAEHLSGIGNLAENLIKHLSKNIAFTEQYSLVIFGTKEEKHYLKKRFPNVEIRTLPIINRRLMNFLNRLRLLPSVDRILGYGKYLFMDYVNLPLTRRSESYTWIHDLAYLKFPETVSPKLRKNMQSNVRIWTKRTTKIVALSETLKNEISEEYGKQEDIAVLNVGVDQTVFYPRTDDEIEKVRHKYRIPKKYILFVGNIEPRKNIQGLVEAYLKTSDNFRKSFALVIIGSGGWNNEEIKMAISNAQSQNENVIHPKVFIPNDDLAPIMSGASLLVHPALYEGFGMTPLEAISSGTKVLASDIPVFREIYKDKIDYMNPYDSGDMSIKIEVKATDQKAPNKDLLEQYSWPVIAEKLRILIQ